MYPLFIMSLYVYASVQSSVLSSLDLIFCVVLHQQLINTIEILRRGTNTRQNFTIITEKTNSTDPLFLHTKQVRNGLYTFHHIQRVRNSGYTLKTTRPEVASRKPIKIGWLEMYRDLFYAIQHVKMSETRSKFFSPQVLLCTYDKSRGVKKRHGDKHQKYDTLLSM